MTENETVQAAARAALEVLDQTFPGNDKDGVNSNFQGLLVKTLGELLQGNRPMNFVPDKGLNKLVVEFETTGDLVKIHWIPEHTD